MTLLVLGGWCRGQDTPPSPSQVVVQARRLADKGQAAEASRLLQSVLPALRASHARELTDALNIASEVASSNGDYDGAVRMADEARANAVRHADRQGETFADLNAGTAQLFSGDYDGAAGAFERARDMARKSDPILEVQSLNNLSSVRLYQGRYLESLYALQEAQSALKDAGTDPAVQDWPQVTQFNLATLYQRIGQDERALDVYRGLLALKRTMRKVDQAHLYSNLGALYRHLGDPDKALESYGRALQMYAASTDADGQLGTLKNIGIVDVLDLNRLPHALETFDRVLKLADASGNQREAMQAHLYRAETLFRMNRTSEAQPDFEQALQNARSLGTKEEEWKALYGSARCALASGNTAEAERLMRTAVEVIESLRYRLQLARLRTDFLADKRDVYDSLVRILLARNDVPGAFDYIERSRARSFQDRMEQTRASTRPTLPEVQKRLRPGTLLLELWQDDDMLAGLWITRDHAGVSRLTLTDEQSAALHRAISELPGSLKRNANAFAPLSKLLAAVSGRAAQQHLLVVPDEDLALVPWEVLSADGEHELLEQADVTYLPSASLLFREARKLSWRARLPWRTQLQGFGAPVAAAGTVGNELPYSAEEVRSIAAMCFGRSDLHLGKNNTKTALVQAIASPVPIVHLSTHASADPQTPEGSHLVFSSEGGERPDLLYLRELYTLDLRNVDLVTLSACETERGHMVRGEGVQAFSRALLSAGSGSTLTTLWKVDDEATAEFMKQFYFYAIRQARPKTQALRLAKLKFAHSNSPFADPEIWAAFVLNGDGASSTPRFVSWSVLLGVGISGLVLVVGLLVWRCRRKPSARPMRAKAASF